MFVSVAGFLEQEHLEKGAEIEEAVCLTGPDDCLHIPGQS